MTPPEQKTKYGPDTYMIGIIKRRALSKVNGAVQALLLPKYTNNPHRCEQSDNDKPI